VTAVNGVGEGPAAGEHSPALVTAPNLCEAPGALVVDDSAANADGGQNTPPDARVDLKKIFVGEPYFADNSAKLVFTIQTAPSTQTAAPPLSEWLVIWNRRARAADGSDRMYVAMKTDASGAVSYEYGNFGPALPLDGSIPPLNANTPTRLGAADAGTYDPVKGVITITVAASKIENVQRGQALSGVNARTFFARPAVGPRSQNISSDITGEGSYQLAGNLACRPNVAPTAILAANRLTGSAPLAVTFDASGSSDEDAGDNVAQYTFNFGDGTAPVTQASPFISHTYQQPGDYFARLTVKDTRGLASTNNAQLVIHAIDSSLPVNYALSTNGATAAASSSFTTMNYTPAAAIDGSRTAANWSTGGGWNDNTRDAWPDWLEVTFAGPRSIGEVRVVTLKNDFNTPQEPTPDMPATLYGLLDFDVQYWNGSAWVTLPGGQVRGNDRVLRSISFQHITTTKIRIFVLNAREHFSRVVEVEALGPSGQ
jgi:PKD repeat protein